MTDAKRRGYAANALDFERGRVDLTHGSGGRATSQLIEQLFIDAFDNEWLRKMDDQACFTVDAGRLAMSTDCHVVSPLFFPGGDIGSLAVHGTINDVAMSGARPLYLTAGVVLEEGLPLSDLRRIVRSMAAASQHCGVPIIAGDTKVVEKGKGDGAFITTTGIGVIPEGLNIAARNAQPTDVIIVNGHIGDHGIAVLSQREGLRFDTTIESDSAALHDLVAQMVAAVPQIHCLRDPTRGGLATALNEIAHQSGVGMLIDEAAVPAHEAVCAACEYLGLDHLYVANEGKLIAICPAEHGAALLEAMRRHPLGQHAAIIGEVVQDDRYFVQAKTAFGGTRMLDWLNAEQLPRIC